MSSDQPRSSWTPLYFVLTFVAGAAVGSWALWIYLIGFPSNESLPTAAASAPATAAVAPAPTAEPKSTEKLSPAPESKPEPTDAAPAAPSATPTPTAKGYWNHIDIPGKSHEECLALTKELNDEYKDCRFGTHKDVWVAE